MLLRVSLQGYLKNTTSATPLI
jgi:carbonic anhydrase